MPVPRIVSCPRTRRASSKAVTSPTPLASSWGGCRDSRSCTAPSATSSPNRSLRWRPETRRPGALRPDFRQCLSCHQMKERLPGFATGPDPHSGTCGMCHDPHAQARPKDALKSCTDAQCHSTWREVKFHTGAAHRKVQLQCITCHDAHAARVDASDCSAAMKRVRGASPARAARPIRRSRSIHRKR
jgi:hypothetical protein